MSHNCVLCKVLFCELCFCGAEAEQKTKYAIFGKNVRSPRTLFFLENTAFVFGVKRRNERAERAELRNGGRTPARRSGGE